MHVSKIQVRQSRKVEWKICGLTCPVSLDSNSILYISSTSNDSDDIKNIRFASVGRSNDEGHLVFATKNPSSLINYARWHRVYKLKLSQHPCRLSFLQLTRKSQNFCDNYDKFHFKFDLLIEDYRRNVTRDIHRWIYFSTRNAI